MSAPAMLTAREAYDLIHDSEPLPGGTYAFCYDVLDLWGAKPVSKESETNLVFMPSSVFAAGMEYAHREGGTANADRNVRGQDHPLLPYPRQNLPCAARARFCSSLE